jgi:hypothetical protein
VPRWDGRDPACWYKWKGDEWIGYDWRAAETKPRIRENFERAARAKAKRLARYQEHRRLGRTAKPSESGGSLRFNGWLWRCPACGKTCRTIYFALPPTNVLRDEPGWAREVKIEWKTKGLACQRCHDVAPLNLSGRNGWNQFIAYVTCGLLYGGEVKRPACAMHQRKVPYKPRINREPSRRRPQVMELLLEGLTYPQIAARLGLSVSSINMHASHIYRLHGVHSRGELAKRISRGNKSGDFSFDLSRE